MKLPYGYVLVNKETVVQEEKADTVRRIFEYYLAGASLGKIVDMLHAKGIFLYPVNKLRLFKSCFFCYTGRKRGELNHDAGKKGDQYIRIAFHYESTADRLVGKGLLDKDFVDNHRKTFLRFAG